MNLLKAALTRLLAVALCATLIAGCGKTKEQEAAEAAAAKMAEAAKKMEEALKSGKSGSPQEVMKQGTDAVAAMAGAMGTMMGGDGKASEPVDFRVLRELLPESIGTLKRGETSGEKAGAMGFKVSHAEARYTGAGNARMHIKITDTGSLRGLAGLAAAAWTMVEIDRESDSGYEKTSTVDGRKMREKWDKKDNRGEVDVIVDSRFIIEIRGTGIDMKELKQAIAAVDTKKLSALKGAAPPAAASK